MNINQLKYFCAVATFQTISDAAEYLHISQPSLSCAIKELENEFGVLLFKRHHRGVTLTPEGEVLYKKSKDALSRLEQMENIMKDMGRERKQLRIGVPPMIGSLILPRIYRDFRAEHKDIILDIVEGGRQELAQKLSEDYLDMIFLPHNRPLEHSLSALSITQLEIVCCVTKNNPLSKHEYVMPTNFENVSLVLFEDSFFQTEEIKKWLAAGGVKPNILLQTKQLSTMLGIISNDIAAGFVFKKLIEKSENLIPVPMKSSMRVDISLAWKKESYVFNAMRKFKEYVNDSNIFYTS